MRESQSNCHCEEGPLCPTLVRRGGKQSLLFCLRSLSVVALSVLATSCSSGRGRLAYTESASPDWSTPRANAANTGAAGFGVLNVPYTVVWSVKTGGVAATEPIVRDGLLFFCGLDRRLEVFDVASGERRFRKRFDGPVLGVIPDDSTFAVLVDQVERRYITFDLGSAKARSGFRVPNASAPPRRLSDSTVLIATWQGQISCLRDDGTKVWSTLCDGAIKNAPAIGDSIIYASVGHSVFALSAQDGAKLWRHRATGAIEAAPALDDLLYIGGADSLVSALDPETGSVVWSVSVDGRVFATPTIGTELIYVASNDGTITALQKSDGMRRWTYSTGVVANLSPTLSGDFLLVSSRQSLVTMLNAHNGDRVWTDTLLTAQASTPPVVIGDHVILADARRNLICVAPMGTTTAIIAPKE